MHQVGFYLRNYIEMQCQQNVKDTDIKSGIYWHYDHKEVLRQNSFCEDSGIKFRSWPKFYKKKRPKSEMNFWHSEHGYKQR